MIKSETLRLKAKVGFSSLVGYNPDNPFPRTSGNYFGLADHGLRVLNFWAENLEEARTRFLDDGEVDVKVWTWTTERGGVAKIAIIYDDRIPDDWYNNKLCFTGSVLPPMEVAKEIYDLLGDPDYEFERFIDRELYHARRGERYLGEGGVRRSRDDTAEQLMAELKVKRGGILSVVHTQVEDDVTYQIEKLWPPVLRGAGARHYRLWANGRPCTGRQYHYELQTALDDIEFMIKREHHNQLLSLQARISRLERSQRLVNERLDDGEFKSLRHTDVWNEVRQLMLMACDHSVSHADKEGQERRVRMMIRELEQSVGTEKMG